MTHHPGSALSAFVDGRLRPTDAERVMAHVVGCAACAAELAGHRRARQVLSAARDVEPVPDLTARLLALRPAAPSGAQPAPVPPSRRWSDSAGFADSVPLPGQTDPASYLHRGLGAPRRGVPALVGVAGCLAVLLGGLVALGDRPTVSPQVHRTYALRVLAEAIDGPVAQVPPTRSAVSVAALPLAGGSLGGDLPAVPATERDTAGPGGLAGEVVLSGDEAHAGAHEWLARHGWVVPETLPPGWTVQAVRRDVHGPGDLEVDLDGPYGTVVVLQQRGRLAAGVDDLPALDLGGRQVRVASQEPWHVVWQCGDVVVTVLAEGHATAVHDVVVAHPALDYDDGVPARISRGWAVVAGAWAP